MMKKDWQTAAAEHFPYRPTRSQEQALYVFSRFANTRAERPLWLLKGSAGTGKTTLIRALAGALHASGVPLVLLAPTGRAAKVMSAYTGLPAGTIHRHIYYPLPGNAGGGFRLRKNACRDTVFIVDEVSMMPDSSAPGETPLLRDLLEYVYSGAGCKLILSGDEMQLPPVGYSHSPALDKNYLQNRYGMRVAETVLDETVRQQADSAILQHAVRLRELIDTDERFVWRPDGTQIIIPQDAYEWQDYLYESFGDTESDASLFITRSNIRANLFNRQIRRYVYDAEGHLSPGESLMAVKNNYFYPQGEKDAFIANGERLKVLRVHRIVEKSDWTFAEAELRLDDSGSAPFEAVLWLDSLYAGRASMPQDERQRLFETVAAGYPGLKGRALHTAVRNDPYFQALQVKYAYAVTAHKAQGGQWKRVFIENPVREDPASPGYKRWLYTALTRAVEKVYLIGFDGGDVEK